MKKELWLIFLIVFIGLLGFGIVIPTLPFIAERFGANATTIGILGGTYSFFQFIASPILGRLSDKYGRKPLLSISLFGTFIGYLIIAFTNNLWMIFLSRIIDGITGGNISVAQAYIGDITKGKERTKAMGLIGAAFGLGFVFGPLLGGLLSSYYGFKVPYLFAGFLALLSSGLTMLILPESEKRETQKKVVSLFNLKVWKEVFNPIVVFQLLIVFFIIVLSFSLMQGIMPLYTQKVFSWQAKENGWFFAYVGVVSVFVQGFLIRKLVDKISEENLIKSGIFLLTGGFIFLSFFHFSWSIYLAGFLFAFGNGLLITSIQSKISLVSNQTEQGMVMGVTSSIGSLARTFGPVVGGFLFSAFSFETPFIVAACLVGATFLYTLTFI